MNRKKPGSARNAHTWQNNIHSSEADDHTDTGSVSETDLNELLQVHQNDRSSPGRTTADPSEVSDADPARSRPGSRNPQGRPPPSGKRRKLSPMGREGIKRSITTDIIDPVIEATLSKIEDNKGRRSRRKSTKDKKSRRSTGKGSSNISSRAVNVALPALLPHERKLFQLVSKGSLVSVRKLLKDSPDLNVNCSNFQGLTPLRIAVQKHDVQMMKLLLRQEDVDVGDCTLYAIRENQLDVAEILLNHCKTTAPGLEFVGVINSSDFPHYVTPLVLAAQCGSYEMVEMLMDRGHTITRLHPPRCTCYTCKHKSKEEDGLQWATERLEIYRAIANPTFICLSSDDMILTSFMLYQELRDCAIIYHAFRPAYMELAAAVREFPVRLIDGCRSSEEVKVLLKQRRGFNYHGNVEFPRLMLAIDYNQKEFVAHQNCQRVLDSAWCGDWYEWPMRNDFKKILTVFPRMLMLPVIFALCLFAPRSSRTAFYGLPVNKMLSSVAAYLIFLVLLFCESNLDKKHEKRGPPKSGLECIIVVFVVGHIWMLIRLCILNGCKRFCRIHSNMYDVLTQGLFLLAFMSWFWALIDISMKDTESTPRKYWNAYDPALIAESFFTLATIMAFGRLLFFLEFSSHIGPLQVSIGKTCKDFAKFGIIILITMLAFAAGLGTFYEYYQGMIQLNSSTGSKTVQTPSFVNIGYTLKTLFWALFCMSPLESADVIIENLPGDEPAHSITNTHKFTQTVGYICLGMFEILSVIMLVNMLLANVCNTMTKVIDNAQVEWIYVRSKAYLNYMNQSTLPPPFNLIPTASGVSTTIQWARLRSHAKNGKEINFPEEEENQLNVPDFPALQAELYQRYCNTS